VKGEPTSARPFRIWEICARSHVLRWLVAICVLLLAAPLQAYVDTRDVKWDQHPGAQLPLALQFRDEESHAVTLGNYLGARPIVLVLVYFSCPQLCPEVLHGVKESLQNTGLLPGRDYALLAVSIDPRDTPAQARAEKAQLLGTSPLQPAAHFLTAGNNSAAELARVVGLHYVYDAEHGQFAHAAGLLIVNPRGQISRYLFGVRYPPAQVRTALLDAGNGRIGTLADQLRLLCYHFDPTQGRYSLAVMDVLRVGGAAAVLIGLLSWWCLAAPAPLVSAWLLRIRRGQRR
jgi:protein SCO1/2